MIADIILKLGCPLGIFITRVSKNGFSKRSKSTESRGKAFREHGRRDARLGEICQDWSI